MSMYIRGVKNRDDMKCEIMETWLLNEKQGFL